MKKLLVVLSLILVLTAILSLTVFAQAENTQNSNEEYENNVNNDANDEMPPMKIRIDGKAFLNSLGLMGKGMVGIFVVTLVIVGVVAILNWHGQSLDDRKSKKQ
ncbi:MAG: hypothetical protein IJ039_05095 [Clostridia bacterium]|nr:hypothetical protein [Clostridia bacterium]